MNVGGVHSLIDPISLLDFISLFWINYSNIFNLPEVFYGRLEG